MERILRRATSGSTRREFVWEGKENGGRGSDASRFAIWRPCPGIWETQRRHWWWLRGTGEGPTRRGGKVNSGPCLPTKKHGWHRVATSTPRGCPWKNYSSVAVSAPRRAQRCNYSGHVVLKRGCTCRFARIRHRSSRINAANHLAWMRSFPVHRFFSNFSSFSFFLHLGSLPHFDLNISFCGKSLSSPFFPFFRKDSILQIIRYLPFQTPRIY